MEGPRFNKGERLLYYCKRTETFLDAEVVKVHVDDPPNWYYSVRVGDNERVTDEDRLTRTGGRIARDSLANYSPQGFIQSTLADAAKNISSIFKGSNDSGGGGGGDTVDKKEQVPGVEALTNKGADPNRENYLPSDSLEHALNGTFNNSCDPSQSSSKYDEPPSSSHPTGIPGRTQSQALQFDNLEMQTEQLLMQAAETLQELEKTRDKLIALESKVEGAPSLREADRAVLRRMIGKTVKSLEKPHFGS